MTIYDSSLFHFCTAELRELFIKEGGLKEILRASNTKEIKLLRAVATCMANLAQEGMHWWFILTLHRLMQSKIKIADVVKDIFAGDGLKKILGWISQGDEELTGSAISILANASNNGIIIIPPPFFV